MEREIKRLGKVLSVSIVGALISGLLIFMIIRNYIQLRDALIVNEQKSLLTIANSTAKNIEIYFRGEERNLKILSIDSNFLRELDIQKRNKDNKNSKSLEIYYKAASQRIDCIQVFDRTGKLLIEEPNNYSRKKGINQHNEVEETLKNKQYMIGKPIYEDGNPYVYLSQPIEVDGDIKGVIRSKVNINYIYESFVKEVRIGEKGYASVKTRDGRFLMHPKKDQLGKDILGMRKKSVPEYHWEELEELFIAQRSGESGTKIYKSVWVLDEKPILKRKFNGYAPIKLGDDFWIATVATDYDEVVDIIRKNYYFTIIISATIMLAMISIGVYILLIKLRKRELEERSKYLIRVEKLNIKLKKDIVKREKIEKELFKTMGENKEKEVLLIHQSRYAAMGEMIGNIAHQWRQPLSSLSLLLSNIEDSFIYDDISEEETIRLFKKSRLLIQKMSETIDDFRDFFKPKTNKEEFTMDGVVKMTLDICEERMKHHNIEFHSNMGDIAVSGYFNQFNQVMLNLINNSIDALLETDKEDKKISMSSEMRDGMVIVKVEDNGMGIPEGIIEKIFDPYYSTKDEKNGTGLGLYMSKMIIEKNFNGEIRVYNNEGAVFEIIIPIGGE